MERQSSAAERTAQPDTPPPTADELDFALLELAEPVGAERGVIALPTVQPKTGRDERLYIAQHPAGGPIQFADDTPGVIGLFHANRRLRYRTRTEGGSSGSPVFDRAFRIVALHHLGDPKYRISGAAEYNQGVPISLIAASIAAAGHGALIAPLQDDLELEADRKEKLVSSIQTVFGIPDYTGVFKRYLGHIEPGEIMPGGALLGASSNLVYEKARKERLLREYIGRVLEQKWSEAGLRSHVLTSVEALARPVVAIDQQISRITEGFNALLARLGDDEMVRTVGPHISGLWVLADHLGRLKLLKRLHEALRELQVKGAEWLTPTTAIANGQASELSDLLGAVVTAATQARDEVIAPNAADFDTIMVAEEYGVMTRAMQTLCGDCIDRLGPIATRFMNPTHAGTVQAGLDLTVVRGVLAGQPANAPRISAPEEVAGLVFAMCRDLPLKGLRQAFRAAEAIEGDGRAAMRTAGRATVELADALRRRAVEQALWQEIDGWLYEAEQHASTGATNDPNVVVGRLASVFKRIQSNVARLDANRPDGKRITEDCQVAFHAYYQNLSTQKLSRDDLRKDVEDCFAALVLAARSRTRAADRAFFADCVRIAPIGDKILGLYTTIGLTWAFR
jgi:hypothetical protein